MKTLTILNITRKLINNGWCQGTYAYSANNDKVSYDSPYATNFCLQGALARACLMTNTTDEHNDIYCYILKEILAYGEKSITDFNDDEGRTKEDILVFLDTVISKEEERNDINYGLSLFDLEG